jgi:hypothetical protein
VYGTLTANGALVVEGNAEFRGEASFEKQATFEEEVIQEGETKFIGRPTFNSDTAGFAMVKTGQDRVHVTFEQEYAQRPPVKISLGDGKFSQYHYENLTTTGFDIVLTAPTTEELKFTWMAFAVNGVKTTVNQ